MKEERSTLLAAGLGVLAVSLIAYWALGPQELATWQGLKDVLKGNLGTRGQKAALAHALPVQREEMRSGWQAQDAFYIEKVSLPIIVQSFFLYSYDDSDINAVHWWSKNLQAPTSRYLPANAAERIFTRFLAVDAVAAAALALSLVLWRRRSAPARQLAVTLGLFALALACFLVNGQARLRGGMFTWPSWSRLFSDVVATLALGFSLLGLERFFSNFPVRLEDWQVIQTQLRWRGRTLVSGRRERPWYMGGRGNLVSLATRMIKLIMSILLIGTVLSTLPVLIHSTSFSLEMTPEGVPKGMDQRADLASVMAGLFAGFAALTLFVAFGWLIASSLMAKLRAGREQCTDEERRQADWLFAGGLVCALMLAVFSIGLLMMLFYWAWGSGDWLRRYGGSIAMMFFPLGWAVMLIALAGAIFFHRIFGPKPLLKRTILISGTGLVVSLLLASIEHFLASGILSNSSSAVQHGFSAVLAGGIVIFPLGIFRHKIEHGVDGFLNRYMPATVIADGKRRDLAVAFADLGGFAALSAVDEKQALHAAGHLQKAAAELARRHSGRIVKTIGDAVLWVFATPTEAFSASLELSEQFKRESRKDGLPDLPVNSGVHFGSLVEAQGGDVYGAAVNLAARLQGAAKDGTVVASGEAVLEVAGRFRFEPLGRLELKNIPTPIPCFRVLAA